MTDKNKQVVHLVAGARPNFMKIAPLWHILVAESWCQPVLVHTGQHFDENMSGRFFSDLNLPDADYYLEAGSGTHAVQTAQIMIAYEQICISNPPDWVVVVGDVNSTFAATVVAKKLCLPVAHLEAGLRSGDLGMPEELNRKMVDSVADILWTPSIDANHNLLREGVAQERIEFVGNIMIDALEMLRAKIEAVDISKICPFPPVGFGVATIHRPSNVDTQRALSEIITALIAVSDEFPIVFPVHPRTAKALEDFNMRSLLNEANIFLLEPLRYVEFMALVMSSRLVITDSGGIQEETSYLGIPCFTLRNNTERPITIEKGTNRLVKPLGLLNAVKAAGSVEPPAIRFWDGKTASRVALSLRKYTDTKS